MSWKRNAGIFVVVIGIVALLLLVGPFFFPNASKARTEKRQLEELKIQTEQFTRIANALETLVARSQ
jgi:hypothetical protein